MIPTAVLQESIAIQSTPTTMMILLGSTRRLPPKASPSHRQHPPCLTTSSIKTRRTGTLSLFRINQSIQILSEINNNQKDWFNLSANGLISTRLHDLQTQRHHDASTCSFQPFCNQMMRRSRSMALQRNIANKHETS